MDKSRRRNREPTANLAELLVLRATASAGRAREGLAHLQPAADRLPAAPPTAETVAELDRRLPPCIQAVALPAPALYGSWTEGTPTAA